MTRSEAKDEIKRRYAEYFTPAKKKGTYICPLCNNGTGSDGDGIAKDPRGDGTQLKCFKCGTYGDVIDYYMAEHSCDYNTAFEALCKYFNIIVDQASPDQTQTATSSGEWAEILPESSIEAEAERTADFMEYYKKCRENISDPKAQEYLSIRGISRETAAKYWIGYDPGEDRLIIPATRSFYLARDISGASKIRYKNPKGASTDLFNAKISLYNSEDRPVFITEGVFDALSILEVGVEAVALNSTSNVRKLLEQLRARRTDNTLILSLDNDDEGKEATEKLESGLRELDISYITANICGECKDANEALTTDREAFTRAVKKAERESSAKPDNTMNYILQNMAAEIEGLREQSDRKTGYRNLDAEAGSIYAGLYAVGGISSVGKTTFMHQLADQMAEQGQHILFFSLEQSRLEMVSKSIARQMIKDDPTSRISSLQIRTGAKNERIARAATEYLQSVDDRMSIIEGNLSCNVSFIGEYTKRYIRKNGVKPVVMIDYLQILRAEKDPETGRKPSDTRQITDYNVTQLKRLSRSLEIPIFIISSLNRSNYLTPIDFEAFKESGGIEYTADVVWGLQLSVLNDEIFAGDKKISEKRKKIKEAKEKEEREVELVCLKNRYGKSHYTAKFKYRPYCDYFMPTK